MYPRRGICEPFLLARRLQCCAPIYMECRIDLTHHAGTHVVCIAGRLTDVQVPDLLRVCGTLSPLQLDLAQLDSANAIGIEALQRLQNAGAEIIGATRFIQFLLGASHAGRK
jgi:hypothetical protein